MNTRILILEDNPNRVKQFKTNFINADITCVTTVGDCKKELINKKWDVLFLDHDLGGKQMVESGGVEETGYDIAKFLSINIDFKPAHVYTHSLNPIGRKNISALINASEVPFIWSRHIDFEDKRRFE